MCNKLVALPLSLIFIIIINVIRQQVREGETGQFWSWSQLSAGLVRLRNTSNALETFLLNLNACHSAVKIFQCGLFGAPLLSTFFYHSGSGSLGPTCCAVFWWDLNMTADLLTVCLTASLPPPPSVSLSFSVCLCVCVSWLSSLLDKLNLLFSVFQYKRQACYDKNWLLSKWNLFPLLLLLLLLYLSPPSLLYSAAAAVAFPCRAVTTPSWSGDRAHRMIALQCPLLTLCPTHILVFIRFLSFLLRIELFAWVGLVSAAAQICALGMLSLFLPSPCNQHAENAVLVAACVVRRYFSPHWL